MNRFSSIIGAALFALVGCSGSKPEGVSASDLARGQAEQVTGASATDIPIGVQATNRATLATGREVRRAAMSPPRFNSTLPVERNVISGSGLSVAHVTRIIRTRDFDKFLDQLRVEAAQDPLAQDATAAQGDSIRKQLGGTATLQDFSCGLSICAGVMELGKTPASYDRFADAYLSDTGRTGSLLDYRVDSGGGRFQQRFVMSYDPAVNGITFAGSGHR